MSQGWWATNLTPGNRTGGNIIQGDLAPEDLILHKLRELLVADAKLLAIFTANRIEVLPWRNMFTFRDLPRLQLYASSTTEVDQPTQLSEDEIEVFMGIRYQAHDVAPVAAWQPTVASVVHRIRFVLRNNRQLADQSAGATIQLAREGRSGGTNFIIDAFEPFQERTAFTQEMSWIYTVSTDDVTGKLQPIVDVGGT